jgi:hypothetical protein
MLVLEGRVVPTASHSAGSRWTPSAARHRAGGANPSVGAPGLGVEGLLRSSRWDRPGKVSNATGEGPFCDIAQPVFEHGRATGEGSVRSN